MSLVKIQEYGNNLLAIFSDGARTLCYSSGGSLWYPSTGGTPGPGPGPDPTEFDMVSNDGTLQFTIEQQGMLYARVIFDAGVAVGLPRDGIVAAFMCVMVEAPPFLMYANSNVPDSLNYPHDAVGSDNDSLGLFQQRPAAGWGTVAELMDADYNARAFYGGPSGPNSGSPAGLLDISPAWDERATLGEAVQAVQVSAFPDRYDNWSDACYALHDALASGVGTFAWPFTPESVDDGGDMPPVGSQDAADAEFGWRASTSSFHEGIDAGYGSMLQGAPVLAAGAGEVVAGPTGGWGNVALVFHGTIGGSDLYTRYAHMEAAAPPVGTTVAQGTQLGTVGNTGNSFGAHLHYETHICGVGEFPANDTSSEGAYRTAVDPRSFHATYGDGVQ